MCGSYHSRAVCAIFWVFGSTKLATRTVCNAKQRYRGLVEDVEVLVVRGKAGVYGLWVTVFNEMLVVWYVVRDRM